MELLNENGTRLIEFKSDLEISFGDEYLDELDLQLSMEDEQVLKEIEELNQKIESHPNLMDDLLSAVKKGTMDYIDAMTDTGDTFNEMKNPKNINEINDVEIDKKSKPLGSSEDWSTRTIKDAKTTPFDNNVTFTTQGMSKEGVARFERYKEVYKQRTKTITAVSKDGNVIHSKTDSKANFESLSGLRSFRFGPVAAEPSVQEMKERFNRAKNEGKAYSTAGFIRKENYAALYQTLIKEFGFKNKEETEAWIQSCHLTPHETADGIFLVPSDVHGASSHTGYCSKLKDVLDGKEGAEESLNAFKSNEAKQYIAHEAKIRGVRSAKGIGLNAIKDVMKFSIATICTETISEFKVETKDSLLDRIKRIIKKFWEKAKAKVKNLVKSLLGTISKSLLTELLTAINDFLLGTFKNIFKIIRQMIGSIKNAIKVIFNKDSTWSERIFEASKILAAGAVGVLGFSLNELIEKGLASIGMPFSSFIAECLSGLFAGILSAIVLMLFDHIKGSFEVRDNQLKLLLLERKSVFIGVARIEISSIIAERSLLETYKFFDNLEVEINKRKKSIEKSIDTKKTNKKEIEGQQKKQIETIGSLKNLLDDGNEF